LIRPSFWSRWGKWLIVTAVLICLIPTLRRSFQDAAHLPMPHPGWISVALALFLVHYLIQAFGWHGILRALGQPVPIRVSLRMYYLSLLARWMPGRVWYSATRLYLGRTSGLSVTAVSFGMIMELIYVLLGGILASLLFSGALFQSLAASATSRAMLGGLIGLVALCGLLAIRPQTLLRLSHVSLFRKAMRRIGGEELTEFNMPRMSTLSSLGLLTYYTLFWIYSGGMFGVLAHAFMPMTPKLWTACVPAFAGSWLVGFFSLITPAGLGTREGAMWLILKPFMPPAQAAVLAVSSRLMMMATELLCAGLTTLLLRGASPLQEVKREMALQDTAPMPEQLVAETAS